MEQIKKPHYSKSHNSRTGVTYVYEVIENYWDKDKKQSRNKRKLVGKIDPVTGEIVPTGKRGRPAGSKNSSTERNDYHKLYEEAQKELKEKDQIIAGLRKEMSEYALLVQKNLKDISEVSKATEQILSSLKK